MTEEMSARELFRKAYENRYTWDESFPGYTMDITFLRGEEVFTGSARINPDLKAEVFGIEDEGAKKELQNQLWEIGIHRIRKTFEETHGNNTFTLGATDETGATEIVMGGKAEGDHYKIRNNEVCLVYRLIRGLFVTINTFSSHDTGAGYLSHCYDSIYRDAKTGELKGGKSEFEDSYEKIGGYHILTSRRIQSEEEGGKVTREFGFSNIKLL